MKIQYIEKQFRKNTLTTIDTANKIIDEYQAQGFSLTLRQLYYQFVARGLIPNTEQSYSRLGDAINNGRLAGLIDWFAIEDRTRWVRGRTHWDSISQILDSCVSSFHKDMWENQLYRPQVWIEKDALIGVIEGVCQKYDVDYFACRGYVSQSEQWRAGRRFMYYAQNGQQPIVFHLGDHDPSGIDMTRDNDERLDLFSELEDVEIKRLALNMDQVQQHNPPPNPTKITDSRAGEYIARFGHESWELDALEPAYIKQLIEDNIVSLIDHNKWDEKEAEIKEGKDRLRELAEQNK